VEGDMNRIRTVILLATLTALLLWAGHALAGRDGLIFALVLAGLINFDAYWFCDKIVLRLYGAREVSPAEAPDLYATVRGLALRANLPMPRLYLIPEEAPNALATGRDPRHGAVAVTQGLLQRLSRDEIAGVIAHELAHIQHRDTLIMTVAATLAGALSMLANAAMWLFGGGRSSESEEEGSHPLAGLLGVLVAPLAATLIQMAISRAREFLADAGAARITGQPLWPSRARCARSKAGPGGYPCTRVHPPPPTCLSRTRSREAVDIVPASDYDRTKDVVAATLVSFIEQEERESLAVVDKLLNEVNTHGLAVAGTRASFEALRQGQVDVLVLAQAYKADSGWTCGACGATEVERPAPNACSQCGERLRELNVKEEMVRMAEQTGSGVEVVGRDALLRLGGVGCLLRFLPPDRGWVKAA